MVVLTGSHCTLWTYVSLVSNQQVDFKAVTRVTGIATQGRHDAEQWVKTYQISYSRDGSSNRYCMYRERQVAKVTCAVACSRRSDSKQRRYITGRATGNKARKKRGGFAKSGFFFRALYYLNDWNRLHVPLGYIRGILNSYLYLHILPLPVHAYYLHMRH